MEDIRKGVCPLCQHNEILEAETLALPAEGPARVAIARLPRPGFIAAFKQGLTGKRPGRGALITFACRRCGFAQSFVADCGAVPIGEEHGTRLIKGPESAGAYR
jgi:hypothetical protein